MTVHRNFEMALDLARRCGRDCAEVTVTKFPPPWADDELQGILTGFLVEIGKPFVLAGHPDELVQNVQAAAYGGFDARMRELVTAMPLAAGGRS